MRLRTPLATLLFLVSTPLFAAGFAITPKASTLGAGLDLTIGISHSVNARIGGQAWTLTRDIKQEDINYEGEADLSSAIALLDFHPAGSGFRFSAGAVFHRNEFKGRSNENSRVVVNGVSYRIADVGQVEATITPENDWGPYAGIGYGNAVAPGSRVKFSFDIGAFYQGEPQVDLAATANEGVVFPPGFAANLAEEERTFQEEASEYDIYPVVSFGLSYRF